MNLEVERGTGVTGAHTTLAASITRAASKQTYYTVRCLVDRDLVPYAYRAYAYFRWVDDCLDLRITEQNERILFVERQQAIINRCYQGERPSDLTAEECLLAELIAIDQEANSGLQAYIRNMMAVMAFDANRRGRLISQLELTAYADALATAVTEALHYFIGHHAAAPSSELRYLAATGAHITHMLRDTVEDTTAGYYNIPGDYLHTYGITPWDMQTPAYRAWVRDQIELAHEYFAAGKAYLAQVENHRCRLAGYAYIARFEPVLEAIERNDYRLGSANARHNPLKSTMKMGWSALALAFSGRHRHEPIPHPTLAK